ncbi:MAG TPA: glycoside hydrolase family 43 protein [Acidimicrobiales bacterium]|nr:glycoside hydrolase family 43 protein [Acidimicrobiales bacterium]
MSSMGLCRRYPHAPAQLSAPAAPGDFPDPYVVFTGEHYLAYATGSGGDHIQVRVSQDLLNWANLPDALPQVPAWSRPGRTWSPAVHQAGGQWLLWYATLEPISARQALSVAKAGAPTGPFHDTSTEPAVFQADLGGSIDPSVFVDTDGQAYLVWKADSNALGRPSTLWGQQLAGDGARLSGEPVLLLTHDRRWERPVIEAPCVTRDGDGYLLLYSAGRWASPAYAVGFARSDHPLGPWTKITKREPWLSSGEVAAGPGGQETFVAEDGALMMVYHAWSPGLTSYKAGGARTMRLGRLQVAGETIWLVPGAPTGH